MPDLFLIGRVVIPHHVQMRFVDDPVGTGRSFAQAVLRLPANHTTVAGRPLFDAWESFNEAVPGHAPADVKRTYDDFQVAFAEPIKQAGFEPVAMNFSTGNMLGDDFLAYFPGTLGTYTYLGFHEYDWPDLWRLHCQNIAEKDEGGMYLALRYRRIMTQVRKLYGDRHKVIITECGVSQGVLGGQDVGPWHPPTVPPDVLDELNRKPRFYVGCPDGIPHRGTGRLYPNRPLSERRYWQSLKWYNHELMKDRYVTAALLFCVGALPPWESFEHLGGIIDRLEAFQDTEPPPEPPLEQVLLDAAAEAQLIQFNPKAALQKALFADGFAPNSPEFEVKHSNVSYVAQRAEHAGTGEVRVYYAPKDRVNQVTYVRRQDSLT